QQIGSKLSRLIAAIRERKIGKRDFRLFRSFYDELESQFELFVGKAFRVLPDGKSKIREITLAYMNVETDDDNQYDFGLFSPVYAHYTLTGTGLTIETRRFPLVFMADHVEFRFNNNPDGKLPLRYTKEQINEALVSSLLLSRVLPDVEFVYGQQNTPVVIPHQKGLFFGYAQKEDPGIFDFHATIVGRVKGRVIEDSGVVDPGKNSWSPSSRIFIKTFVPSNLLSQEQLRLRQNMLDILDDKGHEKAFIRLLYPYMTRVNFHDQNSSELAALENDMAKIMESPEWAEMKHRGQKHLPQNKWKPKGRHIDD
ncbi:MAG: hypothetical protein AB8B83_04280, partial [Bdellovibrionales bacterium]